MGSWGVWELGEVEEFRSRKELRSRVLWRGSCRTGELEEGGELGGFGSRGARELGNTLRSWGIDGIGV